MFTFYVPFGVLPDWNADHLAAAIKRNGSFFIWAKKRVINSIFFMSSFVIVAYFINYYLLPVFFIKEEAFDRDPSAFILFYFPMVCSKLYGIYDTIEQLLLQSGEAIKT